MSARREILMAAVKTQSVTIPMEGILVIVMKDSMVQDWFVLISTNARLIRPFVVIL